MGALEQARTHFEAADFRHARKAAMQGLGDQPDDVELLRVAGRAGVELGAEDAAAQLRRVAEQRPDEAEAWRDLGDALAAEGSTDEANEAFRKVLELEPGDEAALTALGHDAFASGRQEDAVSMLSQAAEGTGGSSTTAAISLVEMYKVLGKQEEALQAATAIAAADPDDPVAALDVAQLNLDLGRNDEAVASFERLRDIVEHPEEEVAALHGAIKAELARGDSARALELARQASALDTVGRTTGVLAHLEAEAGEVGDELTRGASVAMMEALQAPPSRAEVDAALDATLADAHRDWAEHDRRVTADDLG